VFIALDHSRYQNVEPFDKTTPHRLAGQSSLGQNAFSGVSGGFFPLLDIRKIVA
jgi:hypothetical protein